MTPVRWTSNLTVAKLPSVLPWMMVSPPDCVAKLPGTRKRAVQTKPGECIICCAANRIRVDRRKVNDVIVEISMVYVGVSGEVRDVVIVARAGLRVRQRRVDELVITGAARQHVRSASAANGIAASIAIDGVITVAARKRRTRRLAVNGKAGGNVTCRIGL